MKNYQKKILHLIISTFFLLILCASFSSVNAASILNKDMEEVDNLSTHLLTTGSEKDFKNIKTFAIKTSEENERVPMKLSQKGQLIYFVYVDESFDDYCTINVYSSKSSEDKLGYSTYLSDSSEQNEDHYYFDEGSAYIPKSGTYYIEFSVPGTYIFSSVEVNGSNRELKENTTTMATTSKYVESYNTETVYFKLTAKKTGCITLSTSIDKDSISSSLYCTVCDSKKRALSEEMYLTNTDSKAIFAVKAGKTYYIKITASEAIFTLKYKTTAINEKSGTKESNAKTLNFGKAQKGIVLFEDKTSTADYYKFTLNKTTKVNLTVKGNVSSKRIYVTLYSKSLRGSANFTIGELNYMKETLIVVIGQETLAKGTYYIKVEKEDKEASGFYALLVSKGK